MNRSLNAALAACAALFFTLGSIGTIIAVPPASAAAPSAFAPTELA